MQLVILIIRDILGGCWTSFFTENSLWYFNVHDTIHHAYIHTVPDSSHESGPNVRKCTYIVRKDTEIASVLPQPMTFYVNTANDNENRF